MQDNRELMELNEYLRLLRFFQHINLDAGTESPT
jgi:hypothetical protein